MNTTLTPQIGRWYTHCCVRDCYQMEDEDDCAQVREDLQEIGGAVYPTLDALLQSFWECSASDREDIREVYPDWRPQT